jgi:hypothetical protein
MIGAGLQASDLKGERGCRGPLVSRRVLRAFFALMPLLVVACGSSTMSGPPVTGAITATTKPATTYPTYEFVCTKPDKSDVEVDIVQFASEHVTHSRSKTVAHVFCTTMLLVSNPEPVLTMRSLPSELGEEMLSEGERDIVGVNVTLLPFPNFLPIGTSPLSCSPDAESVEESFKRLITQESWDVSKAASILACANRASGS